MKLFRYSLDPACLLASACYVGNRWLVPIALKGTFLRGHFADLLLIPAALPPLLWVQRRVGLRKHDAPPEGREVWLHLAVWSIAAEAIAPRIFSRATGDGWDVVAYAVGAIAALFWWKRA